jgi:hypothetical protein
MATRTPTTEKGTAMTDTITTDPDDAANTESRAAGTIEHIDPHTLVLDPNVRDEADVDADFLASIKEHGVLIPIAAVRIGHSARSARISRSKNRRPTTSIQSRHAPNSSHSRCPGTSRRAPSAARLLEIAYGRGNTRRPGMRASTWLWLPGATVGGARAITAVPELAA